MSDSTCKLFATALSRSFRLLGYLSQDLYDNSITKLVQLFVLAFARAFDDIFAKVSQKYCQRLFQKLAQKKVVWTRSLTDKLQVLTRPVQWIQNAGLK